MTLTDTGTGEVLDERPVVLVPLHIAELDEDALLAKFPSPAQCAGALIIARERIANAPEALEALSSEVKAAKRRLVVARGRAFRAARQQGLIIADARAWQDLDDDAIAAREAVDDAELALEYGRDLRKTLSEDIEILRSLNANFRGEHR